MIKVSQIYSRLQRRWTKFRLTPIRVFCLHHITSQWDASSMCEGDWMEMEEFQRKVLQMQQSGVEFISLSHAYELLKVPSLFRRKKYAVLTFDDGYRSLHEVLPWLIQNHIPATLFINGKYTDGQSQRYVEGKHFSYLTLAELQHYVNTSHGLISLQSHGYEHLDATTMTIDAFREQIAKNMDVLSSITSSPTRGVSGGSFHAYTWGHHNPATDAMLHRMGIVPVLIDGMKNYNAPSCIHRELLS